VGRVPHGARYGAELRSASRQRRPPHRAESGKFCASSSANLLAFVYGPPWAWIDGYPVLAELYIEYGLVYTARFGNGRLGAVAHDRDGLARHHELPQVNGYPFHSSEQDMISAAGIKDQELAIIAERTRINHPSVARGPDLAGRPGGDRYALFRATEAVGGAKFLDSRAVDRQRERAFGGSKSKRWGEPAGIIQRGEVGPPAGRLGLFARARGRARRTGGGIETLFELGDQLCEIFRLASQLRRALALLAQRLLRLGQPLLPLLDEHREALTFVGEHE